MKLIAMLIGLSTAATATEYQLQYTPPDVALTSTVAGYGFNADGTVYGTCSYTHRRCIGGRGTYSCHLIQAYQICTWDRLGVLLSVVSGYLAPTPVLYVSGSEEVYSVDVDGTTCGADTAGFGFVDG